MIKKILLSLGLIGLSLISFASAECTINTLNLDGVYKNGYMHSSIGSNAFDIGITSKGTLISQSFGFGKNVLAFDDYHMFWWDIYGNPYLYYSGTTQGYFQYYGVCDELTADSTGAVNCSKIAYDSENSKPLIQNFLSTTTVNDYYGYRYYKDGNNYHYYVHVCFSSHEIGKSLCFKYYRCTYNVDCRANNCNLTGSLGYSKLTFASIPDSIIGKSPGLTGGNSGGGVPATGFDGQVSLSNSDIISYYESQYGFNYNMCFVGTWDFTQNDGTFKQGNGDNIFSYFNWFYGLGTGVNATGYKLSDVGKFIDEMYGNYDIYFNYGNRYANGDITYIYKFYIDTHILDWVETGYNNPFEENTYVYTFYPKMLHYYTDYWRLYYYGGELANYCYYKLNLNNNPQEDIYGDLENDISQQQLDNIGMWHTIDYNFGFSQSGNNITVSEDWNGSPVDYFANLNSGGYENFDAGTFFSESFNRFKGVFGTLNPGDFGFGYLPSYIIGFLLAIILFRFLSH